MSGVDDKTTPAEVRYKVGEVCRLADVQPYVLRYWESEFPVLAAPKGQSGPRTYSVVDLKVIERIKKLLYDEGYTIAGAKKRLEAELRPEEAETAPAEGAGPALEPPPLPSEAQRPKRPRARAATAAPPLETSLVFEEAATEPSPQVEIEPPPETAPAESTKPVSIDRAPAAVVQRPDPRVERAIAELKEIVILLSREEPDAT